MNETISTIQNRRSTRRFKPDLIGRKELDAIIDAGLHAPSTMNQQSWDFTVLRSKDKIDALNDASKKAMEEKGYGTGASQIFYNAPVVVIVSFQKDAMFPTADCSAAIQNMLLAAHSLGIGSCWIGGAITYFTSDEHGAEFGVPDTHSPFFTIAFGYAEGNPGTMPARKSGTVRFID